VGKNRYEQAQEYVHRYQLSKIGTRDPYAFLDLHPGGELVVLQGEVNSRDQAAVFELTSGHILWQPEAVPVLCWLPNSGHILLLP
jgi:hypothetical protein